MGYDLRDGFGALMIYEYVKYKYKTKPASSQSRRDIDEDYLYLFGIYITMEHDAFIGWLDRCRGGTQRALTDYQASYFAFLKEMVEDVYGIEDRNDLGMAFIDGEACRPEFIMVESMMPNFHAIFWATTYVVCALLKIRMT